MLASLMKATNKDVFYLKKSPSNRGYSVVPITDALINALTNGLSTNGTKEKMVQKLNFLMTKYPINEEETEWKFYPVKLLYRSEAERILNALIRNETFPTYAQMQYMYNNIEAAIGQEISWYFDPSVFNNTIEQMYEKYGGKEDADLDFNTPQEGLERIGEFLCLRDCAREKTEAEWYEWYDRAWAVAKKIWEQIPDKRGIELEQDDLL